MSFAIALAIWVTAGGVLLTLFGAFGYRYERMKQQAKERQHVRRNRQ